MENKIYTLYGLYGLSDLRIRYIGITKQDLSVRLYQHKKIVKNTYKTAWIKHYNYNIGIRALRSNLTKNEARKLEIQLIRKYKYSHRLVNLQDRGFNDKIGVSEKKRKKISNTLKKKYKNNEIAIQGEIKTYVWNNYGQLIYVGNSRAEVERKFNISPRKVGSICNAEKQSNFLYYRRYKDLTFTDTPILPINRYFKCYDNSLRTLQLCLNKHEILQRFNLQRYSFDTIDKRWFKNRYFVTINNRFPPIITNNIILNGKKYTSIDEIVKLRAEGYMTSWYKEVSNCLQNNTTFIRKNFILHNEICAWYKFGELLETPEGFKTKEELETINLNVENLKL